MTLMIQVTNRSGGFRIQINIRLLFSLLSTVSAVDLRYLRYALRSTVSPVCSTVSPVCSTVAPACSTVSPVCSTEFSAVSMRKN